MRSLVAVDGVCVLLAQLLTVWRCLGVHAGPPLIVHGEISTTMSTAKADGRGSASALDATISEAHSQKVSAPSAALRITASVHIMI